MFALNPKTDRWLYTWLLLLEMPVLKVRIRASSDGKQRQSRSLIENGLEPTGPVESVPLEIETGH